MKNQNLFDYRSHTSDGEKKERKIKKERIIWQETLNFELKAM